MKLAEALQERADLQAKIAQLSERINNTVLVQEGEVPAEDPTQMLEEVSSCIDRMESLVRQINLSNCQLKVDGESLTAIIAKKDMLTRKLSVFKKALSYALQSTYRARGTDIKILPAINVGKLRKDADAMAMELRLIDNKLQKANWTFDLIED